MASLNYLGSKKTLLPYLTRVIKPLIDACPNAAFCDLFSGTGCVANHFKHVIKDRIVCNDMELYAYVLARAQVSCVYNLKLAKIIDQFNVIFNNSSSNAKNIFNNKNKNSRSLVFNNFANNGRLYFSAENALKIDQVRTGIHRLYVKNIVSYNEFLFLLASLLVSASIVANTCGTFRAHLKQLSSRAKRPFKLVPVHCDMSKWPSLERNVVKNKSSVDIVCPRGSIVYLDPPYTSAHYGAYYSFLNYLCLYDGRKKTVGTGTLCDYNKSGFGLVKRSIGDFKALLENTCSRARHVVMSYSSAGVVHIDRLINMMRKYGNVVVYQIWYKAYKSSSTTSCKRGHVIEYIITVDCNVQEKWKSVKKIWMKL